MPLYEYECSDCGHRTEVIQRVSDPPLAECPECGGAVRRLLSAPAVQFKGSGWYVTDYAGRKGSEPSAATSDSKQAAAPADGKSKDKSEKKASEAGSKAAE